MATTAVLDAILELNFFSNLDFAIYIGEIESAQGGIIEMTSNSVHKVM